MHDQEKKKKKKQLQQNKMHKLQEKIPSFMGKISPAQMSNEQNQTFNQLQRKP